jgi:hypothetical protein
MGSGFARHLAGSVMLGTLVLVLVSGLVLWPERGHAWSRCHGEDDICTLYLNVVTDQGTARLSVDRSCGKGWRHEWRRADAHQTIRQWLAADAGNGRGGLCVLLDGRVDEIRITSIGGHCGYEDGAANAPGPGVTLRQGRSTPANLTLTGCHASIGDLRFGGVALDFADGYGFGDTYAAGHFYGVYDGFRNRAVGRTGGSVWRISQYNTFHYRVEILAHGSTNWGRTDNNRR